MPMYLGENMVAPVVHQTTDSSDATATADDIANGKTAYVKGTKVTGQFSGFKQVATYEEWVEITCRSNCIGSGLIVLQEQNGGTYFAIMASDTYFCQSITLDSFESFPFASYILEGIGLSPNIESYYLTAECWLAGCEVYITDADGTRYDIFYSDTGPNAELGVTAEYYVRA